VSTLPQRGKSGSPISKESFMASYSDLLVNLQKYSEAAHNTPIQDVGKIIIMHDADRQSEQLTAVEKREAYNVAKPLIAEIYAADPDAELDPAEIATRVGMPDKQGSRSFVRHQLKQLRIAYHANANGKAAAD
jgi:hypothetical protein